MSITRSTAIRTAAAALVTASALLVGGCSGPGPDGGAPTPTPTRTPTPTPSATAVQTVYDTCHDDLATVLASAIGAGETVSLDRCGTVGIVGQGREDAQVELGAVGQLVVEGNGVHVTVDQVDEIVLLGEDNVVRHHGTPKVIDEGVGNTVTAE